MEKARELGAAWVRVTNIDRVASAASVTAGVATGPFVCLAIGPGGIFSLALPAPEGLPVVLDTGLGAAMSPAGTPRQGGRRTEPARRIAPMLSEPIAELAKWAEVAAPEGDWLIGVVAVAQLEPLATFHERVLAALQESVDLPRRLLPNTWEARRREAREHGLSIAQPAWKKLTRWAQQLGVEVPIAGDAPRDI